MAKSNNSKGIARTPLSRERVLNAALSLADVDGLEAITMRNIAQRLGVEAMSLYKHVGNKDDILDSLVEVVVAEMAIPSPNAEWRSGLRDRSVSARGVLLRHRWAAVLIESRNNAGSARLRLNNGIILLLRNAGFSIELAYSALLTLDSYIYGFTLQEVSWTYTPEERPELLESFRPKISPTEYPQIVEMMNFVMSRSAESNRRGSSSSAGYSADYEFGLEVVLDGVEMRFKSAKKESRKGSS